MAVARQPLGLRNALIFHRILQNRAAIELADETALDFLPRSLGFGRELRRCATGAWRCLTLA